MTVQQKIISPHAWAALFALAFIWGGSFVTVRIALDEIGPLTVVAHRTGWAMVLLWAYVIYQRYPLPKSPAIWCAFLIMGALNNVIPFSLMAWGQLYIESGLTSILNAATSVFGVVLASFFFADERLTPRRFIGVIIGFLGVAIAIGWSSFATLDLRSLGQLAVIGGTVSYAFAGIWARKMLSNLKPQVAATGMVTGATVIMLPLAWCLEGAFRFDLSPVVWGAIAYYAIVATALAYLLYYYVLQRAGSGNLMLCTLLVAPVAIVLGAVILGETLQPRAYAGFAVLALGLILLDGRVLSRRSRHARHANRGPHHPAPNDPS